MAEAAAGGCQSVNINAGGEVAIASYTCQEEVDYSGGNVNFDKPVALHCTGGAGIVRVDLKRIGSNRPIYLALGAYSPALVTRVYQSGTAATGLEACHNHKVEVVSS